MVIRIGALAGLVLVVLLLAAESAMACSCAFTPPQRQLELSDGAVIARLLRVKPLDDVGASAAFVYRTGKVLKGARHGLRRGRRLVVRSARQSASCGLSDQVGRLTGLFLTREDGRWHSSSCREASPAQMRGLERASGSRAAAPCS
jgi:hypothetical protein